MDTVLVTDMEWLVGEIRKEFTIKPGQKLNLGDIRIAKPST